MVSRSAGAQLAGPGRLPLGAARAQDRALPASAGLGHDHARGQGDVPDDGGIRRVRAGNDRGSRQVRAAPGQAARDQERQADRPPTCARAYAGSNPGSLSGRWHRNARSGKALSGQPWHGADTAQPRTLTTQTAPSKSELSVKKISLNPPLKIWA